VDGQQSLMSLNGAATLGFGGGQLMAARAPDRAGAADAAVLARPAGRVGGVPLTHLGSVHSRADAATGGTPLVQSGSLQAARAAAGGGPPLHRGEPLQAAAVVAVRPSEPAARAAEMTALAASRLTEVFSMTRVLPVSGASEPTVTCTADAGLKPG
jgi:hypothetical protein